MIDGAQYPDAKHRRGTRRARHEVDPGDRGGWGSEVVQRTIRSMQTRKLAEIVEDPEIRALYEPLYRRHLASIGLIRERSRDDHGVIFFDLDGCDMEGYNKFIPYYLFPDSMYTVSVSPSAFRTKISSAPIPGRRSLPNTTWQAFANAMEAGDTPTSAPLACRPAN